jgi:hypothetical protein
LTYSPKRGFLFQEDTMTANTDTTYYVSGYTEGDSETNRELNRRAHDMHVERVTKAPTVLTSVIRAQDFSDRTTDANRDRWTLGKMRYVVDALQDTPVIIVIEGLAKIGARLIRTFDGGPSRGQRVTIESVMSTGETQRTNYRLEEIGDTIIPMVEPFAAQGAKWDIVETHRSEQSAAIGYAQRTYADKGGHKWGEWRATEVLETPGTFDVTYTPHTGNDYFADKWGERGYWRVTRAQIEAAAGGE